MAFIKKSFEFVCSSGLWEWKLVGIWAMGLESRRHGWASLQEDSGGTAANSGCSRHPGCVHDQPGNCRSGKPREWQLRPTYQQVVVAATATGDQEKTVGSEVVGKSVVLVTKIFEIILGFIQKWIAIS